MKSLDKKVISTETPVDKAREKGPEELKKYILEHYFPGYGKNDYKKVYVDADTGRKVNLPEFDPCSYFEIIQKFERSPQGRNLQKKLEEMQQRREELEKSPEYQAALKYLEETRQTLKNLKKTRPVEERKREIIPTKFVIESDEVKILKDTMKREKVVLPLETWIAYLNYLK